MTVKVKEQGEAQVKFTRLKKWWEAHNAYNVHHPKQNGNIAKY